MERAELLAGMSAQLVADVTFYPTACGGRASKAFPGWGCPCCVSRQQRVVGYDGWPLLGDIPIEPGEQRRLGFVFLSGKEAADVMRKAGTFYLWDGRFIGEAKVVESESPHDRNQTDELP